MVQRKGNAMSKLEDTRHKDNYADIIDLPHHQSETHPHMSMEDRAAQFSPFAALTGHSDAIKETARLTDRKIELSEDEKLKINEKLQIINSVTGSNTIFDFIYFVPDEIKKGGAYISYAGSVKRIDDIDGFIYLHDGTAIEINQIVQIESEHFQQYCLDE